MAQAAEALGVTVDAIRARIKRGTMDHTREGGRVYVLLGVDQDDTSHDQGTDQGGTQHADQPPESGAEAPDPRDELLEELRDRVRYLEEESRRKDHLLAAALERIPVLEAPREPPDAPETAADEPERVEPRLATGGAQEAARRRPWWRRWFGG